MTEPRTAAGRALLDRLAAAPTDAAAPEEWVADAWGYRNAVEGDILRIEAEAAELAGGLDAAWAEAEAALVRRADWWRIRSLVEIAFAPMRWEVVATDGNRIVRAEGHDPAAALHELAAVLGLGDDHAA